MNGAILPATCAAIQPITSALIYSILEYNNVNALVKSVDIPGGNVNDSVGAAIIPRSIISTIVDSLESTTA